jgi:glutathione S-transferase
MARVGGRSYDVARAPYSGRNTSLQHRPATPPCRPRMIELLQFAPAFGLMNASPFCMKVEVFLRLAGLEYRTVSASPLKAPKGKLPVVREGDTVVADSEAIVAWLQVRHGDRLPGALRNPPLGADHALRRMLEEHTYFALLWLRWIDDAAWPHTRDAFFGALPAPLRALLPALVRRKMRRDLLGQGVGRHARDEIGRRACADLAALGAALGKGDFFGGDDPATLDATTYAFLANLLWAPVDSPVREHLVRAQPALVRYCERMDQRVGR